MVKKRMDWTEYRMEWKGLSRMHSIGCTRVLTRINSEWIDGIISQGHNDKDLTLLRDTSLNFRPHCETVYSTLPHLLTLSCLWYISWEDAQLAPGSEGLCSVKKCAVVDTPDRQAFSGHFNSWNAIKHCKSWKCTGKLQLSLSPFYTCPHYSLKRHRYVIVRSIDLTWTFKKFFNLFLFLTVLDLHCCAQVFPSCSKHGWLAAVCGLLSAVASLVSEHRL